MINKVRKYLHDNVSKQKRRLDTAKSITESALYDYAQALQAYEAYNKKK